MAAFVESLIEKCLGELSAYVEGEIYKILGVKEEIEKLRRRLERIRAFLQDAERKRHEDAAINAWVRELRDVTYDADDILDLCMLKGGKLLEVCSTDSGVLSLCMHFSCFKCIKYRCEVASRIQKLNGRLKEIAEDREITPGLQYFMQKPLRNTSFSRPTYSLEVQSDIAGTEIADAAQELIDRIIQNDEQNCQTFGITGMGGIGKSTLARKIFNDEKIKDKFPLRLWLYVSRKYSEIDLLSAMIRSAGGHAEAGENKTQLADKLASLLSRHLFLVMDDVWSADVWWKLIRDPIISREVKSRILVTTRDQMVVASMQATYIHRAEKMSQESGWALLCREVFGAEGQGNHQMDVLMETGIKIVEKCDGLPLAIKVIGGVLRCRERSKTEWERALASDSWRMNRIDEELPGALYLSYDDLPLHLKQCFLYCSIFPISSSFELETLWQAEGFLVEQSDRSMEAIAREYYSELLWRNLLQLDPAFVDQSGFFVHDLLRSLGESLGEGEGVYLRDGRRLDTNSLTKIRRLSISYRKEETGLVLPDLILEQKCLRSLLVHDSPQIKTISNNVVQQLKRLRVLSLESTAIEILPNCIGQLQHLRYLNLRETKIHGIPESIGRLANLQSLLLSSCKNLHVLPKATTRLHNLRLLALDGTSLTHAPKGIGSLKNLSFISEFIIGHDEETTSSTCCQGVCPLFHSGRGSRVGCDLEELRSLSKMSSLGIVRLERATINESASAGSSMLFNMPLLETVHFEWTTGSFLASEEDEDNQIKLNAEKVLDHLYPPSNLQWLLLKNYPGQRFARWMMCMDGHSFPNLAYIDIRNLPSCAELPQLGQLPQLKFLRVRDAKAIQTIGPEFFQSSGGGHPGASVFPKLDALQLLDMPNLEELQLSMENLNVDGRGNLMLLPSLTQFCILRCPKLRALPECLRHAANLKELIVSETPSLMEISDLSSLTEKLCIEVMQSLKKISNLPSLKYLEIADCPSLEQVTRLDTLQHLVLENVQVFPVWLSALIEPRQGAPTSTQRRSFRKFELCCGNSSLFDDCLREGINWPIIQQIPEVKIQTDDGKKFMLYSKDRQTYETNA